MKTWSRKFCGRSLQRGGTSVAVVWSNSWEIHGEKNRFVQVLTLVNKTIFEEAAVEQVMTCL